MFNMEVNVDRRSGEGARELLIPNRLLWVWSRDGPNLALPDLVRSSHTDALCILQAVLPFL